MPVLFGDTRPDGLIRVWRTLHRIRDTLALGMPGPSRELTQGDMGAYPEGYWFEVLPDPPEPRAGINHVMLFHPATGAFSWEEEVRPLTQEETVAKLMPRVTALEQATGVSGPGTKGIAQRLDAIEGRIKRIEDQLGIG